MAKINGLWGNIFHAHEEAGIDILQTLKGVPIFRELKSSEIREFERIIHHRYYKANETIFWEGEPGVGMYIIQHGDVGIFRGKDTNAQEELARLSDGDFFGDMALLNEAPRSATAISLTESHILGLFRPDLFGLIERHPRLGNKVLVKLADMIARRLRQTNEELQEIRIKMNKKEILL
ncbi:cyclic nucleotide-binding domain-containing protein [candidate division KSB1 bacterium]|nr:cyclic nucleotide-binding domain-containing protein [candidate division KSB1 bacterium]